MIGFDRYVLLAAQRSKVTQNGCIGEVNMIDLPKLPIDGVLLPGQGMARAELRYLTEEEVSLAEALQREVVAHIPSDIYYMVPEENWYRKRYKDSLFLGIFLPEGGELSPPNGNPLIAFMRTSLSKDSEYAEILGFPKEQAALAADVDDALVREGFRGNRLMQLMLEVVECVCEAMGKVWMLASVHPDNLASLRSFLQKGYRIERKCLLYEGKPRYIMKKGIGTMKKKRALLLIDYTYDFVAEDGKLTAGAAGQAIEEAVAARVRRALDEGEEIYVLNDIHDPDDLDHPEHKLFPPHNIAGSSGRALYGRVKNAVEEAEAVAPERVHRLDKTRYSAFVRTGLEEMLRDKGIDEVQLAGVCTDICVLHTAVDAYNLGFDVLVNGAEVASFNPEGHAFALAHFKNVLGATVID